MRFTCRDGMHRKRRNQPNVGLTEIFRAPSTGEISLEMMRPE